LVPPLLIFFFLPHDQGEKGPAWTLHASRIIPGGRRQVLFEQSNLNSGTKMISVPAIPSPSMRVDSKGSCEEFSPIYQ
jgi:hypothetical protein